MAPQLGRHGEQYVLSKAQIDSYHDNGYLHLPSILSAEELSTIDPMCNNFIFGKVPEAIVNTSDLTGGTDGQPIENYAGVIVISPSQFSQPLASHVFMQRAKHVAEQLSSEEQVFDMDRILAKRPRAAKAQFKWHQDEIYLKDSSGQVVDFPKYETLILFVELDDTSIDNGCVRYVAGSHKEENPREHKLAHPNVKATTITVSETEVDESKEKCVILPVKKGDMVIHNDRTLHRSGGNVSDSWRRTYVVHFSPKRIVEERNRLGVTHNLHEDGLILPDDENEK